MALLITERVQELRREIADIRRESSDFLRSGGKDAFSLASQERRVQRAREIKEELMSQTTWKKA